jgi:hypothetical protein
MTILHVPAVEAVRADTSVCALSHWSARIRQDDALEREDR